jgi:hypothetical protein
MTEFEALAIIQTLNRNHWSTAWLAWQRDHDITSVELRRSARLRQVMDDRDDVISASKLATIARNVIVDMTEIEATDAAQKRSDAVRLVLADDVGKAIAASLADGHTQAETARRCGITRQSVSERIATIRKLSGIIA